MTYSAPRQGLFAMIILVGMILHLLFFVLAQEHRLKQQYQQAVERDIASLTEELTMPLNTKDNVGISVIAGRYIKNDNIEFVGIYDNKDTLLVPIGKESKQGVVGQANVTLNNNVLGKVQVHSPKVSRAKIIAENWLFLSGVFVLYVLIFLIYGYLARPNKELKQQITKDVRNTLLASGILPSQTAPSQTNTPNIPIHQHAPKIAPDVTSLSETAMSVPDDESVKVIQIRFEDLNNLLDTVSHQNQVKYFALCDQLLVSAVTHLLKLPVLAGVSLVHIDHYSSQGAAVVLKADNDQAKAAVASVMLAKLVTVLNQIVYDKHRELKRFALLIRTTVSNVDAKTKVLNIAKKHRENPLVLLPKADLSQIAIYADLGQLTDIATVDERECRYLKDISPLMAEKLSVVRDTVLTQG